MTHTTATWQNRILRYDAAYPVDQLTAHPLNPWLHSARQQEALYAVLDGVGWWDAVKVNVASGYVVDGHLRVILALRHGQPTVPVLFVAMTPAQEQAAIATANHIARMAGVDPGAMDALLADLDVPALLEDAPDTGTLLADVLGQLQAQIAPLAPPPPEPIGIGLLGGGAWRPAGTGTPTMLSIAVDPADPVEQAAVAMQAPLDLPAPSRDQLATLAGHRAAQPHPAVSPPVQWYGAQALLHEPVLDYGAGMDPHAYARFDPAYAPDYRVMKRPWATVLLNNVLNVIPLEHNRVEALMTARALLAPGGTVLISIWPPRSAAALQHRGYQAGWAESQWEGLLFKVFVTVDRLDAPAFWAWRCLP